ncbi:MAG: phytanoyl-CoA dioxygenase, partial [Caulobacter sp.]
MSAPWIETDDLEERLARADAPEAHKAFARDLARDGLAVIDLGDALLDLCDRIDAETAHHFEAGAKRVHDAWRRCPAIRQVATHPEILACLTLAYGRKPFPFQSLNFHRGSQQGVGVDVLL